MAKKLTEDQIRKLRAAAEIVDGGDMAVIKKIIEFQDFLDEKKEEIDRFIVDVEKSIELLQDNTNTDISTFNQEVRDLVNEIKEKVPSLEITESNISKLSSRVEGFENLLKKLDTLTTQLGVRIEEVKLEIPEIPEIPEIDFTEVFERIRDIENKIPEIPEPDTPKQIREKLKSLKDKDKLPISAIKDLENELKKIKDLENRTLKGFQNIPRGGGVSALGVRQAFKLIAHTEAPVGDIDGVNTTYTVNHDIYYVFGFTLNGEQIAELPNFTYAGRTITFSSALPAVYSGKDFEVKYIG